ncbi:zinc finger MYM-type protein 1-like, partial [Aphis craccivora]
MKTQITMQNYFSAKKLNNENIKPEPNTKISVASVLKKFPRPSDISQNLNNEPIQPNLTFYPKTKYGDRWRHFSKQWFKSFAWLEYSILEDAVYCFPCRMFSKHFDNQTKFISLGFKYWKKATFSDSDEQCEVVGQDVPQNAKYTSPQIQNEMISIFNQIILEKISFELQSCNYFALIVDETKDKSKTEQLSVVVRYYIQGSIHERFMGFKPAKQLNASSLLNYIKEILQKCSVDLQKCVAQTYDGAAVMSGRLNGVQKLFRDEVPQAIYVHCYNHKLNLVITDICKNISDVKLFFDLVEEIYVFVSGSAVHSFFIDIPKKNNLHSVVELKKICLTRWIAQVFAILSLKKVLSPLLILLHKLISDKGDRSITAKGVIAEMAESMVLIKSLIMTLKNMRNDSNDRLNECDGPINYICFEKIQKLRPPKTVSLLDALNKIKGSNITLNNGEQFVFVNESAQIIIVTCKTNLKFLCNEVEFILADGTFTYCHKHFYQQYTIHGVCKQYYVPLVFCFLPSKTKEMYKQMWETLKDLCLNYADSVFQPSLLLLYFELRAHFAVKEVYPLIIIKACRFHLGQAWYRKISSIPILKKNYNDKNSQSGLWLKLFFEEKQFCDFSDYILDNYIETNHFPPILWAEEPNKSTRTTNGAESYHSQLRHEFYIWMLYIIYVPHPTIFHSIDVLKQQQQIITEIKFRLIQNGN